MYHQRPELSCMVGGTSKSTPNMRPYMYIPGTRLWEEIAQTWGLNVCTRWNEMPTLWDEDETHNGRKMHSGRMRTAIEMGNIAL